MLNGGFLRRSTEFTRWEDAKRRADLWERQGSAAASALAVSSAEPEAVLLEPAIRAFQADCEQRKLAEATVRKYRYWFSQLEAYFTAAGFLYLKQITTDNLGEFRKSTADGSRADAGRISHLRAFFRFCLDRQWVDRNPAAPLRAARGAHMPKHKSPFTDAELGRIREACDGEVRDFVDVLTYTGMRISDASLFDISRLQGNDVFLRQHKTGKPLFTWIPDWLRDALRARAELRGTKIFLPANSMRIETVTDIWRKRLNLVFSKAGEFEEAPTPHRFRHTFARVLLQRGVPTADVAELIGDTEEMVRKHYARWVPERQERLTAILRKAFDDRKVAVIKGGRKRA